MASSVNSPPRVRAHPGSVAGAGADEVAVRVGNHEGVTIGVVVWFLDDARALGDSFSIEIVDRPGTMRPISRARCPGRGAFAIPAPAHEERHGFPSQEVTAIDWAMGASDAGCWSMN